MEITVPSGYEYIKEVFLDKNNIDKFKNKLGIGIKETVSSATHSVIDCYFSPNKKIRSSSRLSINQFGAKEVKPISSNDILDYDDYDYAPYIEVYVRPGVNKAIEERIEEIEKDKDKEEEERLKKEEEEKKKREEEERKKKEEEEKRKEEEERKRKEEEEKKKEKEKEKELVQQIILPSPKPQISINKNDGIIEKIIRYLPPKDNIKTKDTGSEELLKEIEEDIYNLQINEMVDDEEKNAAKKQEKAKKKLLKK